MENKINTGMIMDGTTQTTEEIQSKENLDASLGINKEKLMEAMARYQAAHTTYKREYKKIGRNDDCPCGSGKKYKNCCLSSGKYEQKIKA